MSLYNPLSINNSYAAVRYAFGDPSHMTSDFMLGIVLMMVGAAMLIGVILLIIFKDRFIKNFKDK